MDFEYKVASELRRQGWVVTRQVRQHYRTDKGRECNGRIDLVATKGEVKIALELDRIRPRKKSRLKLDGVSATHKAVLLRESAVAVLV